MLSLAALILQALVAGISGLLPIPLQQVGFVYNSSSTSAPVHFDFYIDQNCPYSKAAWPTILSVADHYGPSKLKLTTHLFPLPYHRNSFYASKGTHIVDKLTSGRQTYQWIKVIFDKRDELLGSVTFNMPDNLIVKKYADIASASFGLSSSNFTQMLMSDDIEMATRVGWKYCCSRGVAATPTFMINDVVVSGDSTWTLDQWKQSIDPLFEQ